MPFRAGGATDIPARLVAPGVAHALGEPVVRLRARLGGVNDIREHDGLR